MNMPNTLLELSHFPVMLSEVVKICNPKPGDQFLDCTFGGGGYTKELLKFSQTEVIAIDRDISTIKIAKKIKKDYSNRFSFFNEKFSNIERVLKKNQKVDAIIFDLGMSSFQLLDMTRGFSFKSKDKLDMKMGLGSISAEEIINDLDENILILIIKILGEEKEAKKIVKNIIKARSIKRISLVSELVKIIEKSKKKNYAKKINVCTKTFQALRIFANKETSELIEGITKATKFLKVGGKIIVISFHSIEDKIVKFYFNNYSENKSKPSRYLPEEVDNENIFFESYRNKPMSPSKVEIEKNPPSRSAKLRFALRNKNIFKEPNELKNKFKKYLQLEGING
ncbi:16S rRNA (cytosine(1402)-N(4))-methyltransferase RsmH [Pelagibacteraceae bacterium]|nr:16S rRNA (cytosine(1402)-N(4))-methyltransferase RsmH [Pelagibacteraceae bacterium]